MVTLRGVVSQGLEGYEPKATVVTLRGVVLEGYEPSPLAEGIRTQYA